MIELFEDLFVLELANNHRGNIERGKKIIAEFSKITASQNVKTAIKLQFRDGENFVQKNFRENSQNPYINKVLQTKMAPNEYKVLIAEIRKFGHITVATPFDETSANICAELDIDIIKIASANINDLPLIKKIAEVKKPVIISTGGAAIDTVDNIVAFFEAHNIPLAINHCVSIYPSEANEMQLNQIDFLKNRYPLHTIGLSTHELDETLESSMLIAYAKGARLFERHIDLEDSLYNYCSNPEQIEKWLQSYKTAKTLCGSHQREFQKKELEYLKTFERGVYAKKDIQNGQILTQDDVYFAIPKQEGQMSSKEFTDGIKALQNIAKDSPVTATEEKSQSKETILQSNPA